MCKRLTYNLL